VLIIRFLRVLSVFLLTVGIFQGAAFAGPKKGSPKKACAEIIRLGSNDSDPRAPLFVIDTNVLYSDPGLIDRLKDHSLVLPRRRSDFSPDTI